MSAYYNEFDSKAASWLRELIKRGLIADGEVDERNILDVQPDDLRGYTQCHFFAGIGGWSYALRLAGWPDNRPVWTGSPPCQPFSASGKQLGPDDERHLAPHWLDNLVAKCRPERIFGEQVASATVFGKITKSTRKGVTGVAPEKEWCWFDDLSDRLERAYYACGASDIPASSIGAPHIRQRTFFGAIRMGDANDKRLQEHGEFGELHLRESYWEGQRRQYIDTGISGGLADTNGGNTGPEREQCSGQQRLQQDSGRGIERMADSEGRGRGERGDAPRTGQGGHVDSGCNTFGRMADADYDRRQQGHTTAAPAGHGGPVEPVGCADRNGSADAIDRFWRDADWLYCRDGRWRPVEPGTFPLADGIPARVVRLRGYGNAIVPQAAAEFIQSFERALDVT